MDAPAAPIAIEIFRAGRHIDMHGNAVEIGTADLADIAGRYDPTKHEAPLVIGHPTANAPAYGWVRGLRVDGDVLLADAEQVDAAFAECVKAGRWKKRSASFLLPNAPDNPSPGQYYLNHVGFLGGMTPAVKGLRDVQLAAADQLVEFASDRRWAFRDVADLLRRLRDYFVERDGSEVAEQMLPSWQLNNLLDAAAPDPEIHQSFAAPAFAAPATQEKTMSEQNTVDLAARQRELDDRNTNLVEREQALAEREHQARREDAAAFAAGLVKEGKLLPRETASVVELLLVLPEDKPLSFASEGGQVENVKPADALRQLLSNFEPRINYAEKTGRDDLDGASSADFAAPAGVQVDAGRMQLHTKALDYQREHPNTSYLAAVKAVGG